MHFQPAQSGILSGDSSKKLLVAFGLSILLLGITAPARAAPGRQKRVLILSSLRRESAPSITAEKTLIVPLREGLNGQLDYYSEYIDEVRFPDPEYQLALRDFLRRKYAGQHFDLIVTVLRRALEFATSYGPELFPGTPVFFIAGKGLEVENNRPPPNSTGVLYKVDLRPSVEIALRLQPGLKQIYVVSGASTFDRHYENGAREQFREFENRVAFKYLSGLTVQELKDTLAHLSRDSAVYYITVSEDREGNRFLGAEALTQIAPVSSVPIYSFSETAMDGGIFGGSLVSIERATSLAVPIALRVLRGANPQDIPVTEIDPNVVEFDWRQLQRFGISESSLPPGAAVLFKEPTFWERYKWRLIGLLALLALESLLIVFLLMERRKHRNARNALSKIEERIRAMLRAIPDLMFFQRADGTYLDCHARDPSHLLVPPAQFLGKKMDEVLPPKLCEDISVCFKHAAETRETQLLEYSLTVMGEPRWFEARIVASNGDHFLTIVRDITESRRAEDAVRESEMRFASAFKSNPQPMSITTFADGRYLDVNESFTQMSGFTEAEVIGRTSVELGIFESQAHREAALLRPLKNGSVRNLEMAFRTKDGSPRVLLSSYELLDLRGEKCILVASSDITERKESEQRLAELTARLLRTQDEERRHIARELHDVTAQSIGLMMLNLSQVQTAASSLDERAKQKLGESLSFGEQALKEIRTLSYVLHPPLLDQAGLSTALKWYVKGFSDRSGVKVTFAEEGNNGHRMPPEVEYALFRIVQESLTNIRRHTNSETAAITLRHTPDDVLLSVRDEGRGLTLNLPRNGDGVESVGVGIPGMRHRLKQLGGELLVDSDSNGTIVTATVPVRWVVYDSSSFS